jgi:hypothetical protein
MQVVIKKAGYAVKPSKFLPTFLKYQIQTCSYNVVYRKIKNNLSIKNKRGKTPVFCIVHWNAPDFLLLNVRQILTLYPQGKIYVLDNGSLQTNIDAIQKELEELNNVTLFIASPGPGFSAWSTKIGLDTLLYSHTKGLQFLLNYAAEKGDEKIVFLDQDCILSHNIDDLLSKLGKKVIMIGARYGKSTRLVHASFMLLNAKIIHEFFGVFSFFHENSSVPETYHGLSVKLKGKILFLESQNHGEIPSLCSYSIDGKKYAWHAWHSSRTVGFSPTNFLDGHQVSYIRKANNQAFEYMTQIHKEAVEMRQSDDEA